jgi:hypothetical protein
VTLLKPQSPWGYALVCDDIRQENTGKYIYTGVYTNDIIIYAPIPVSLPKLGFVISYYENREESKDDIIIFVCAPGASREAPTAKLEITREKFNAATEAIALIDEDSLVGINTNLQLSPVEIREPGMIHIWAERGDLEINLRKLRVISQPMSLQPIGQQFVRPN